jgi:acyl dehydratase
MRTLGIGLYWDDLTVGEQFKTLNRTITEADIVNFIGVTGMVETLFTDMTFGDHGGGPMGGRVSPAALVYTMTGSGKEGARTGFRRRHDSCRGRGDRGPADQQG